MTDKAQGSEGKRHVLGWHILLPFNMLGNRLSGASRLQSNCLAGDRGSGEAASVKSRSGLRLVTSGLSPRGLVHGEVMSAGQGACPAGARRQGSLCLEGGAQRQDGGWKGVGAGAEAGPGEEGPPWGVGQEGASL